MSVESAPRLLHNMSAPSKSTIRHSGRSVAGRGVAFAIPQLPAGGERTPVPAGHLLALLGYKRQRGLAQAERFLRGLLTDHDDGLQLPDACPLTSQASLATETCTDLLSCLAVLSKSSAHVYLRSKEPNLNGLRPGRLVVLLVPPAGGAR